MDIYSPTDWVSRNPKNYQKYYSQYELGRRHALRENRYKRSVLQLLEFPEMDILSSVSSFGLCALHYRTVEPQSAVLLTSKIANLEYLVQNLKENEKKDSHVIQQHRQDLAMALPTISGPSLRKFTLGYYQDEPSNQYFSPPRTLLASAPTPKLKIFDVEFNMTAADGEWYFIRDPTVPMGEDEAANDSDNPDDFNTESDTNSDSTSSDAFRPDPFNEIKEARSVGDYPIRGFRTLPSDDRINPLLLAMARAAACVPELREMALDSTMQTAGFSIYFSAAGYVNCSSHLISAPEEIGKPRLYWWVGSWRPDNELQKIWRQGKEDLVVKFLEDGSFQGKWIKSHIYMK
ncbi:MAG: hypothetical protein Q9226_008663, partial [Calogaya cf. arnoldii]